MIPRRVSAATLSVFWLALAAQLLASGGRPQPRPSVIPVLSAADDPKVDRIGPPWPLKLKLVHKIDLDRNPRAASPDDHSRHGAAPPEVVGANVIPPIDLEEDEVRFISGDGRVTKRVSLSADANVARSAYLSPRGTAVAIQSTFSSRVNNGEKAEGGEWPATFTVYDRSGAPMYTTTGGSDDHIRVADNGAAVLANISGGDITFVDPRNGAHVLETEILGPYGGGRPLVAICASGERVLAAAPTTSLDGERDAQVILRDFEDYKKRSVPEVWAAMYDARTGARLWLKQLPGAADLHRVALSDDGRRGFIHCMGPKSNPGFLDNRGFLLNEYGDLVASGGNWGMGVFGARYSATIGGFQFGMHDSLVLTLLRDDGTLVDVFRRPDKILGLHDVELLRRSMSPSLLAFLALRKHRVLLILMDHEKRVLLRRTIRGPWLLSAPKPDQDEREDEDEDDEDAPELAESDIDPLQSRDQRFDLALSGDARFVTIRLAREMRIYAILPRANEKGGQR